MTEEQLISYLGKNIEAMLNDGQKIKGFVSSFEWGVDSDDGEANISLETELNKNGLIVLSQSEIKLIDIIK